jgi:hypothetical protein
MRRVAKAVPKRIATKKRAYRPGKGSMTRRVGLKKRQKPPPAADFAPHAVDKRRRSAARIRTARAPNVAAALA